MSRLWPGKCWPVGSGRVLRMVLPLLLASVVLFGGGGLAFRIGWQHPFALVVLAVVLEDFLQQIHILSQLELIVLL